MEDIAEETTQIPPFNTNRNLSMSSMARVGCNENIGLTASSISSLPPETQTTAELVSLIPEQLRGMIAHDTNAAHTVDMQNPIHELTNEVLGHNHVPQPPPNQVPELERESTIAQTLLSACATNVMAVIIVLLEQKRDLHNLGLLRAYTILSYVSLFFAMVMFLLILYRRNIPYVLITVRLSMFLSFTTLLSAFATAAFILQAKLSG